MESRGVKGFNWCRSFAAEDACGIIFFVKLPTGSWCPMHATDSSVIVLGSNRLGKINVVKNQDLCIRPFFP